MDADHPRQAASRRRLQVAMGLLGCIPVATGVLTMLGLALFWLIPRIERETPLYRALWLMVLAGGIGRLLSMAWLGWPPWPFIGFTVLEVVGAPAFIVWQARIAAGCSRPHGGQRPAAASPPAG